MVSTADFRTGFRVAGGGPFQEPPVRNVKAVKRSGDRVEVNMGHIRQHAPRDGLPRQAMEARSSLIRKV